MIDPRNPGYLDEAHIHSTADLDEARLSIRFRGPFTEVGPHDFEPLRLRDLFWGTRCRACFVPKGRHPISGWTTARPMPYPGLRLPTRGVSLVTTAHEPDFDLVTYEPEPGPPPPRDSGKHSP